MELILAIVIVAVSAGGIGLGLALGRGPARSSCGAAHALSVGRCEDCPLRRRRAGEAGP